MSYIVILEPEAEEDLRKISDVKIREVIAKCILKLEEEPEKRGKSLSDDLDGFYSIRCAGQRYRVVYAINIDRLEVYILVLGPFTFPVSKYVS